MRDRFEGKAEEAKNVSDGQEEEAKKPGDGHQVCGGLDFPPHAQFTPDPQNELSGAEDQEEYNQLQGVPQRSL